MEKFREFWLFGSAKDTGVVVGYTNDPETGNPLHVIEKSAFDELMGIAESLRYALKEGDQFNKHKALSDFEDFKQKLGGGE